MTVIQIGNVNIKRMLQINNMSYKTEFISDEVSNLKKW